MVSLVVSLHSLISSESGYMSQSKVADNISDVAINAAHGSNIAGRIDEIEKKNGEQIRDKSQSTN